MGIQMRKKAKIVVTMGPALETPERVKEAILAGADAFRLNFSHDVHEKHRERIAIVREVAAELGLFIPIIQDIQGPKIRVRDVENGAIQLKTGDEVYLSSENGVSTKDVIYVDYPYLEKDLKPGAKVFIDDGKIRLEVIGVDGNGVRCRVIHGGVVKPHKGVNIIGVSLTTPSLTEKDKEDVLFGIKMGVDFVAQSFVRSVDDVMQLKRFLVNNGGKGIEVIAKIEKFEAVQNLESIALVADGLLIARGDLGVEIPIEDVPVVQKRVIKLARRYAKPVITATQMLESMISSPMPTRAEVTDVANAIFDGTDAVMLSAETSVGEFPIETISTMAKIIERAERAMRTGEVPYYDDIRPGSGLTDAIGLATCELANTTSAKVIITSTESGRTTRLVAKYKPKSYIIAASPRESTLRKVGIVWGVYPLHIQSFASVDALLSSVVHEAGEKGYLKSGDVAVITAGDFVGVEGTTNLIKVATYTPVVAKGIGIGSGFIGGRVTRGNAEGEVLVIEDKVPEHVPPTIRVIIARDKVFSLGDKFAGIPMVVGVGDAVKELKDGMLVTVDVFRGVVYGGQIFGQQ